MGANVIGGKNLGLFGLLAAIIYIVALFVTAFVMTDFEVGVDNINILGSETIYMLGCIFAGVFGILYSIGMILKGNSSGVLISKIRGAIFILAAIALILVGITKCDETVVMVFDILIIIGVICEVANCWVAEENIKTLINVFFAIVLVACFALELIVGFGFAIFTAIWVLIMSFFIFAEACQPEVARKSESKVDKKKVKKQEKANKSAGKVKQAPVKAEPAKTDDKKSKPVAEPAKPKEVKQEPVKAAPVKEQPKEQQKEQSSTESLPKLKVMSSKEAAAARQAKKEESAEPVVAEPVAKAEPVAVVAKEEPIDVDADGDEEEFELEPDTPGALVRRAAWNKGLRCRRDYGEHVIPVAFVKGKVAVYVTAEKGDTSIDSVLESEGWTVLRYLESDVTDGKIQGEEIAQVVKDNLKAERAAKKKKKGSKK